MQATIVKVLTEKGALTDEELFKELKVRFKELTPNELNRILFKLEVRGLVRVTRLARGRRRVELLEGGPA